MKQVSAALVITTYNWKEALKEVLHSVTLQRVLPDEVIIADDGSRDDTRDLLSSFQQGFPCPLVHCWQEDQGFRAAAIRNKAIAKTTSDYIIMIDGDMVLHRNFIRDHLLVAKKGFIVQGGRVITSPEAAKSFFSGHYDIHCLSPGISNRLNAISSSFLSAIFSRRAQGLKGSRTCNFAAWREDILQVNGFNESFIGWGREDSELTARLLHAGKQRLKLKFMATAYHLYHPENSRGSLSENDAMLEQCLREKWSWCDDGINKYLSAE